MAKISELELWVRRQKTAIAAIGRNAAFLRAASAQDANGNRASTAADHSEKLVNQLEQGVYLIQGYIGELKKVN